MTAFLLLLAIFAVLGGYVFLVFPGEGIGLDMVIGGGAVIAAWL